MAQRRVETVKMLGVVVSPSNFASPLLTSMGFKSMHFFQFSSKRLIPDTPRRSVNITVPETTMCGAPNSTTIGEKMAHSQKNVFQLPTFSSHEGSYSEGRRGFHKTPPSEFTNTKRLRHLVQVLRSASSNVFISFRGETCDGFTIHLYKALKIAGYNTFIDKEMKRGVNIDEELSKGIRNADLSVVVISPGYASSQSCLNELAAILHERRSGHKMLPLFFHVDPDGVGSLTGNFGAAFDGLVENLEDTIDDMVKVYSWKKALEEVAGISGLVLRPNQCQLEFIVQSLAWVKQLLNPLAPPRIASWPAFFHKCLQILASYCNKD